MENIKTHSPQEIEKLYEELLFEYKRVNGREFPNKSAIEGEVDEWRINTMIESIKLFKKLPSYKI